MRKRNFSWSKPLSWYAFSIEQFHAYRLHKALGVMYSSLGALLKSYGSILRLMNMNIVVVTFQWSEEYASLSQCLCAISLCITPFHCRFAANKKLLYTIFQCSSSHFKWCHLWCASHGITSVISILSLYREKNQQMGSIFFSHSE